MSDEEVEKVIERFGESAEFLEQVGVHGVEVHGAHGCESRPPLLSPPSIPLISSAALAFRPHRPVPLPGNQSSPPFLPLLP